MDRAYLEAINLRIVSSARGAPKRVGATGLVAPTQSPCAETSFVVIPPGWTATAAASASAAPKASVAAPKAAAPASKPARIARHRQGDAGKASEALSKFEAEAKALGLKSAEFKVTKPGFDKLSIKSQQKELGSSSADEVCQAVVVDNLMLGENAKAGRVRRALIVFAAGGMELDLEKVALAMRATETAKGLPCLRREVYLPQEVGMDRGLIGSDSMPVILSDHSAKVASGSVWATCGHADVMVKVSVAELKSLFGAVVADIAA